MGGQGAVPARARAAPRRVTLHRNQLMATPTPSPKPLAARWAAAIALVALAGGMALAARQWGARFPGGAPFPKAGLPPSAGVLVDTIARALAQAGGDDEKTRWMDEVQGSDVAALSEVRRDLFVRIANTRACTCGCGYTLAACRRYDTTCPVSGPRVAALLDSVAHGWITDATGLRARPGDPAPAAAER